MGGWDAKSRKEWRGLTLRSLQRQREAVNVEGEGLSRMRVSQHRWQKVNVVTVKGRLWVASTSSPYAPQYAL